MNGQSNTSNLWDAVYIDAFADAYDHLFAGREDLDLISHMLARLAGNRPVLKFDMYIARDKKLLERLWQSGNPQWKTWC